MEKLKSIAKSIWAKIPKTKTEFKDLFDKSVSFLERWLHKIWVFLKSAYVWVNNFYQEHSTLIPSIVHTCGTLFWLFGLYVLTTNFLDLYREEPKPKNWAPEVRMAAFILITWFGALFLAFRTMIASADSITAKKQADIAQEKFLDDRFTKAREQLASVIKSGDETVPNIELRIGALYALERTMHDSERDAPAIIDTLATYVRRNCGEPVTFEFQILESKINSTDISDIKDPAQTLKDEARKLQTKAPANREDIQVAIKVIGRRPTKFKIGKNMPDLSGVNFQGAKLEYFDLSFCNLSGAKMQGASMYQVNLIEAELSYVDMQGSFMSKAKMQGADLTHALIRSADMRFASMERADMRFASMERADMSNVNLQNANFWLAEMQRINLRQANLQNAFLQDAEMQGASLVGAQLQGADMRNADLQGAKLRGIKIDGTDMRGADLQDAEMSDEVMMLVMELGAIT